MTDDELITEVSRRLTEGRFGYRGLLSRNQLDALRVWEELYRWVAATGQTDTQLKMNELADTDFAPPSAPFAINTTFYGEVLHKNHQPTGE